MTVPEFSGEPRLSASPTYLDFGIFDPENPAPDHGAIAITISNTGGGVLAGRINPQVVWVGVTPLTFRLASGESSTHWVKLKSTAPKSWKPQRFSADFLCLINSNGGSSLIGGVFIAAPGTGKKAHPPQKAGRIWIAIPALVLLFVAGLVAAGIWLRPGSIRVSPAVATRDAIFTQGAMTVMAQYTIPPTSTLLPQMLSQSTPQPFPMDSMPVSLSSASPNPQFAEPTFTPWPRSQLPNPEQFIRDYYSTINYENYEKSWAMLSPRFQQTCCAQAGNEPFVVYSSWWKTMKRVDVLSAYLQEWDTNPAVVNVALRYQTRDERTLDTVNVFMLIVSPDGRSLVIDEVK